MSSRCFLLIKFQLTLLIGIWRGKEREAGRISVMLGVARKSNRCTKIRRRTECTSPAVSLHHGIIPSSLKAAGCGVGGERRCSKRSAATTAIGLFSSPSCSTNFCNSRSRRPHPIFLNDPLHPFKRPLLMSSLLHIINVIGLLLRIDPMSFKCKCHGHVQAIILCQ